MSRNIKNKIYHLAAVLLTFIMCINITAYTPIYADETYIYINTAQDLIDLSKKCSYDVWSRGKTVILQSDIFLYGVEFKPIPSFGGVFEGNGHTISGLVINKSAAPAGLFGIVQEGALVKDLNVKGIINTAGERENIGGVAGINFGKLLRCTFTGVIRGNSAVGGIAGINEETGEIFNCSSNGNVTGDSKTGGIAGNNMGSIVRCINNANINIVSVDPALDIESITVEDLSVTSIENMNASTDTGGIAGYSSGMLISCTNNAEIGYQHIGYNVGGIVGRSSGYISNCDNNGTVYGRKDVGGIAGQMEPYVHIRISEGVLDTLRTQLDILKELVDKAADNADNSSDKLSARFDRINDYVTSATDTAKKLEDQVSGYSEDVIDEINRASSILADTIDRMEIIADKATDVSGDFTKGLDAFKKGLDAFSEASKLSEKGFDDIKEALNSASDAMDIVQNAANDITAGLDKLDEAVDIKDRDAAKAALDNVKDGLSDFTDSVSDFAKALDKLTDQFVGVTWTHNLTGQIRDLSNELIRISNATGKITNALEVIDKDVDIDWDKLEQAQNLASDAFNKLSLAMDLAKDGLKDINNAIEVKDSEGLDNAFDEIEEGFDALSDAMNDVSDAMKRLSDALSDIEGFDDLKDNLDEISAAIGDLADASSKAADAFKKISDGISDASENISFDSELLDEGFEKILGSVDENGNVVKKGAVDYASDAAKELSNALEYLREAVVIGDKNAIKTSFEQINSAVNELSEALGDIGRTIWDISNTLSQMNIWADNVADAADGVSKAFLNMSEILDKIADELSILDDNIDLDWTGLDEAVDFIRNGMKQLVTASESLESSINLLSKAFDDFKPAKEKLDEALDDIRAAVDIFEEASKSLTDIFTDFEDLFDYLANVEKIQIPAMGDDIGETADELYNSMSGLAKQMNLLNSDASSAVDAVTDDIRAINEQFNIAVDAFIDAVYDQENRTIEDVFNDVSDVDIDSVTTGKSYRNKNNAYVYGDINIGGIAGMLAIEYDLDPEDDITENSSRINRVYETKAILQECVNYGKIVSKKDCAGAIVGRMDIGIVSDCEGYGSVESESGNYVGGIAGLSSTKIIRGFAKCRLKGNSYIGGIIGSGNTSDITGSGSIVKDCRSIVKIENYEQFAGAVAGCDKGSFKDNFFVSDELAGIDSVSYKGKAEPVSYSDIIALDNTPNGFKKFTVSFMAEDNVISTVAFNYGDSIDNSMYPEIPAKEGNYVYWDIASLENLTFDMIVTAQYNQYVTALPSTMLRKDERHMMFVEGHFSDKSYISVVPQNIDENGVSTITSNIIMSIADYFKYTGNGVKTAGLNFKVLEQWKLYIPEDNLSVHTVRYLPENTADKVNVYIKNNGVWEKIASDTVGSYVRFQVEGDYAEILIVSTMSVIWLWIEAALIIALAAVFIILINKRKKKKSLKLNGENK